jgi:hypothetical protein
MPETVLGSWIVWAVSGLAALAASFVKVGAEYINSDLATLLRTPSEGLWNSEVRRSATLVRHLALTARLVLQDWVGNLGFCCVWHIPTNCPA